VYDLNMLLGKTNSFLKRQASTPSAFWKTTDLRSLIKIASIDDEPFQPSQNLKNLKYQITELGDIKDVDEVSDYSIILCDLMGVGVFFDDEDQGASIIREIKRRYPSIFVIAYTGSNLGSKQARAARNASDHVLKKDARINEWTETLDKYIDLAARPDVLWDRVRLSLVENGIDTSDLLKMERAYVKGVLKKDGEFYLLKNLASGANIKGSVRTILTNLVSAAIFASIA